MDKVVVVSGYFDPLHIGHLELIEKAKALGTKLIVILNSDHQCKLKKGKAFMPENEKKKILEALRHVDEVVVSIDKDQTQRETLKMLKPDIFAKGGDRFVGEIPETPICNSLGIKVIDGLGEKIQSSSGLTGIKEIK